MPLKKKKLKWKKKVEFSEPILFSPLFTFKSMSDPPQEQLPSTSDAFLYTIDGEEVPLD